MDHGKLGDPGAGAYPSRESGRLVEAERRQEEAEESRLRPRWHPVGQRGCLGSRASACGLSPGGLQAEATAGPSGQTQVQVGRRVAWRLHRSRHWLRLC